MKKKLRHRIVFKLVGPIITAYLKKKFNFTYQRCNIKPPFLVLCNHTLDFDPFFVAKTFKCPIYFVMSDHVSSLKAGKLIKFLVSPIPITKSGIDAETTKNIFSLARQGAAVGIFPEGNKSFAGDMSWIKPSTAKLAKKLNVPLVLMNVTGGYLSSPRWSKVKRKGHIHSFVKEIISPEDLQKMTVEEIYDKIINGLRVNAYEQQEQNKVKYVAENRASTIESLLYACPECNSFNTIVGLNNDILCTKCGAKVYYDEYGYLQGGKFNRLDEWDNFQKNLLIKTDHKSLSIDDVIFSDPNWEVQQKVTKFKSKILGIYTSEITNSYLMLKNSDDEIKILIEDIIGTAIEGACSVQIQLKNGTIYRLKNKNGVNGLKYTNLIEKLNGKNFKF